MVHEDIDLVRRSLRGERDAFEDLVRKYQDAVYGLAFRGYAEALMRLSHGYSDAHQQEKANEYKQKALKIYEEIGDLGGQAEIWMWMRLSVLVINIYFSRSVNSMDLNPDDV